MNFNILNSGDVVENDEEEQDDYLSSQIGFHPDNSEEVENEPLFDPLQIDNTSLIAPDGHHWSTCCLPKQENPPDSYEQGPRLHPKSRKEAFNAIFDEILDLVAVSTNFQANRLFHNWKITTLEELRALLGLVAITGVFKIQPRRLRELWDERDGNALFPATMSFGRFSKLRAALRFSKVPRDRHVAGSQLLVQEVLQLFNKKLRQLYEPGPHLVIGHMLSEFQGPLIWQEMQKISTGRFGIKLFWILDASNGMPLQCALYTRQDRTSEEESYAMHLSKSYLFKGRNITLSKELTSIDVCRQFAEKDTTVIGAVGPKSAEIPRQAHDTSDRVRGDTKWFSSRNVELCSHWVRGKRPTLLLTTKPSAKTSAVQPELVTVHAATMAPMEQFVSSMREFSTNLHSQSWASTAFFALFDAAVVAAYKLGKTEQTEDLYSFKKELAYELCEAFAKRRLTLPLLRSSTKENILRSFPAMKEGRTQSEPVRFSVSTASHGRCTFCPRVYDRKTRKRCVTCKRFICGPHQYVICPNCFK